MKEQHEHGPRDHDRETEVCLHISEGIPGVPGRVIRNSIRHTRGKTSLDPFQRRLHAVGNLDAVAVGLFGYCQPYGFFTIEPLKARQFSVRVNHVSDILDVDGRGDCGTATASTAPLNDRVPEVRDALGKRSEAHARLGISDPQCS